MFSTIKSFYESHQAVPSTVQEVPLRFVKINGVMRLNPAYKKYREAQGQATTTALNPEKSLPVVSNTEQYAEWCAASNAAGCAEVQLSESTKTTMQKFHEPKVYQKVGLNPDAILADLGKIFAKHEAPIGLLNKLLVLTEYDELEFIIDDSGSMGRESDTRDAVGRIQTRWEEAHTRIKEMLELLAYVPTPRITVCFFNRENVIQLKRGGETPEIFLQNIYKQLDAAFEKYPQGSTPAKRCLENSFQRHHGKRVSRYFFCDGEPDGGESAKKAIACMVKHRSDPQGNPLTFLSCTNEDDQVAWMKTLEEEAPFCAEYDDFEDEAREVAYDQGKAFPFTRGFHLIGQLVGAMYPNDLDAMDESIPFTKWTLENLLGVQMSQEEYRCYFDEFKKAQQTRVIENNKDAIKANYNWEPYFHELSIQKLAKNIDGVRNFLSRF